MSFLKIPVAWLVVIGLCGIVPLSARADLLEYVKKPESKFTWKLKEKKSVPVGTIYDLHLVSQVWQGITWEHQLQVYLPKNVGPNGAILLWNTGGAANAATIALGMELARKTKTPVAFVYHI